ncbi:MAG TPA: DsbA family protein [Myxococcota bacterium]|jgi:predicted DsbA family dithiol-disulfide isomerase
MNGSTVTFDVWSDYLCPWCKVAATRLAALEREFEGALVLNWKSFLLRPRPEPGRELEKFRRYTESWRRAAEEEPAARFRVWASEEGPPTHSVPAHLAAKAAAELGPEAFERMHAALLRAYFEESRDISRDVTLSALWREAGLPEEGLARSRDPELVRRVLAEHDEALDLGVGGVPAVRLAGADVAITGAQPIETYRRWIRKNL